MSADSIVNAFSLLVRAAEVDDPSLSMTEPKMRTITGKLIHYTYYYLFTICFGSPGDVGVALIN